MMIRPPVRDLSDLDAGPVLLFPGFCAPASPSRRHGAKSLSQDLLGQFLNLASVWVAIFLFASPSHAVTILAGASVTNSTAAPLAAKLNLATDVPSRVSVTMTNGTESWTRHFYDYTTSHALSLYGFKPGQTNYLSIIVHDRFRNEATNVQPLIVITAPLPTDFPKLTLLKSQPEDMEPGYTLFRLINQNNSHAYLVIVDQRGEVVWYSGRQSTSDIRQLENGNLFIPLTTNFLEFNLFGDTVNSWNVPAGLNIDLHDGVPTDHGTILYLNDATRSVPNFPSSSKDPSAPHQTTNVMYNRVIEISATNSSLLNTWSPIDVLDPTRIDYLTFTLVNPLGVDCEHANGVIEDPRDDSLIVSMRHQDAVIKFARSTGQLKWILGPHENWGPQWQPYLLTPVGAPFEWQYGQHAPIITPRGTVLLYDDGDYRASPFDTSVPDGLNYSRAVEYEINERTMGVTQVWDYGRTNADRIYTDRVGNADWLPERGNVLITYGFVIYVNGVHPSATAPAANMIRIQEVTYGDDPQVVFDLACFDYSNTSSSYRGTAGYRSHRIPDLYGHLPRPVEDLTLLYENGQSSLQFSADPTRTYVLEASTNLVDWSEVAPAIDAGEGEFSVDDPTAANSSRRYYRVVTY
jgi:arylsulfate sulfotransferase